MNTPGQGLGLFHCHFQGKPNKEVIVKPVQSQQNDDVWCYVERPGEKCFFLGQKSF